MTSFGNPFKYSFSILYERSIRVCFAITCRNFYCDFFDNSIAIIQENSFGNSHASVIYFKISSATAFRIHPVPQQWSSVKIALKTSTAVCRDFLQEFLEKFLQNVLKKYSNSNESFIFFGGSFRSFSVNFRNYPGVSLKNLFKKFLEESLQDLFRTLSS